jgi:signal transduction histidine kinase
VILCSPNLLGMLRPLGAVALLLLLSGAQLTDAWRGGDLVGTPLLMLASVLAGYLVGLAVPWSVTAAVVGGCAAALAGAHQLADLEGYPLLDDLVFSLLVVGAPAAAGAVVRGRARQVRELRRVAALLTAQRDAEVRAAALEERNRLEMRLHQGFSEQVAAIAMRAEGAVGADDEGVRSALSDVEAASRRSLDELREALGQLRAPRDAPAAVRPGSPDEVPEPVGPRDVALALVSGVMLAAESVVSPAAHGSAALNVAVALMACAPLVTRRSRPALSCSLVLGGLVVMTAWLTPAPAMVSSILPVLVCAYTAGAHARGARRLVTLGVVLAGLAAVVPVSPPGALDPDGLLPMLVFVGIAVAVGAVSAGWASRAAQLRAAVTELEHGCDVEVSLAVAEQRNRLAGELHDTVAHAMTVICLQAAAGQVRPEPTRLDAILTTARTSLGDLRTGLHNLGDDHELGLVGIATQASRAGLRPEVVVRGHVEDLEPAVRRLALRAVREALTNAGRYAPGSRVRVEVTSGEVLRVCVTDEGPQQGVTHGLGTGNGLRGLAEEVERLDGSMEWGRTERGFRVEVTLPVSEVLV